MAISSLASNILAATGKTASFLPASLRNQQANTTSATPAVAGDTAAVRSGDTKDAIARQFDSMVYSSQMQRVSLSFTMQQAAAKGSADGGTDDSAAVGQQMTFNFFAESRTEELTAFQEKVSKAAQGVDNSARRESLVQAGQRVASRFKMSVSISGEALAGFANAADGSQKDAMKEVMDKLLALTNKLMDKADDFMNEFLSAFSGNVSKNPKESLQSMMDSFFKDVFGGGGKTGQNQAGGAQAVSGQISIQMEFNFETSSTFAASEEEVLQSDPLMLDLNGDGFSLSSVDKGANFDLLGNGQPVRTAFVNGGDAFLALDRNGDGAINSGKELFGDQNGAANGFEELGKLDSNHDGKIDAGDDAFSQLKLWKDNGDGKSNASELVSLQQSGITEIGLRFGNVDKQVAGNKIAQIGAFKFSDGRYGRTGDALLNYVA